MACRIRGWRGSPSTWRATDASTNSGTDGTYALTNVPVGGAYSVTPNLASDAPPNNGITSADLALIQAHILLVKPLDSPYKLLAADVNGSGTITAGDLAAIQRVVLGISNTFMAGLWRFVPADYTFPDTNQPWSAPTSRSSRTRYGISRTRISWRSSWGM